MTSSKTLKNVARYLEERVHELDRKMIDAHMVSPFAQQRRQEMASSAEVLRLESVRLDAGDDLVVGPDMFKQDGPDPRFGMEYPSGEEV